jgi:hypothetical protein
MTVTYSHAVSDAKNNAVEATIGASPLLRFYGGSVPANARASLGSSTLLAEGELPADWMAASVNGVKAKSGTWTATGQAAAGAGTAATFYRIYDASGTTCHEQGTVSGTGGSGDMRLNNVSIAEGQVVTVETYQKTAGNIG